MATDSRTQVNLVVNNDQKTRWESYAEEAPEASSLSHLVRMAVEKEISSGEPQRQPPVGDSSEVIQSLNRIESQLTDLDERLSVVESEVMRPPERTELANRIFAVLPPLEVGSNQWEMKVNQVEERRSQQPRPDRGTFTVWSGRPDDIASELGVPVEDVLDALQQLMKDTRRVYSKEWGSEKVYWKED